MNPIPTHWWDQGCQRQLWLCIAELWVGHTLKTALSGTEMIFRGPHFPHVPSP